MGLIFELDGPNSSSTSKQKGSMTMKASLFDWHYFFAQKREGLKMIDWSKYVIVVRERFGSSIFAKPMFELVSLK